MTQPQLVIQRSFELWDVVRLSLGFADQSGAGEYEIVRIIPTRASGEREYRVLGTDGHERAIGHDQVVSGSLESVRITAG